ncbi:MAG: phosphatidylserine decarboxylase family protein [Gammaproteobacteria bacterium]|nr:MAG: phosphatidylserine decarboxylase family protein [Gammaproteobacteria bacterium]
MLIARQGVPWVASTVLAAVFVHKLLGLTSAVPLWVLAFLLVMMYRDPERNTPADPLGVISPADGHVISVDECHDPFLNRPAKRIRIKGAWFAAWSARSPTEGQLIQYWFGAPETARDYPTPNPIRHVLHLRTDEGDDVIMLIAPPWKFGRGLCSVQTGERIGQGRRCGVLPMRAMVDILMADDSFTTVAEGDWVYAGETVIARLRNA